MLTPHRPRKREQPGKRTGCAYTSYMEATSLARSKPKRGIMTRAGLSTGIVLYTVGFFVLFVAQMKTLGAIMFLGGILLALVGLYAKDTAEDREREGRHVFVSNGPVGQPLPLDYQLPQSGTWEW